MAQYSFVAGEIVAQFKTLLKYPIASQCQNVSKFVVLNQFGWEYISRHVKICTFYARN